MTSQSGKQAIAIHVSPDVSRSKSNQAIEFRQLIEYNMITFSKKIKIEHISRSIV